MKRTLIVALIVLLVSAISSLMPAGAADVRVFGLGVSFIPPTLRALPNDTVTLTTLDQIGVFGHTFTTDDAICAGTNAQGQLVAIPCNTGVVGPNQSATVRIHPSAGGSHLFYCEIHRSLGMLGIINIF